MSSKEYLKYKTKLILEYIRICLKNETEFKIDFIAYIIAETIFLILSYFFALFF